MKNWMNNLIEHATLYRLKLLNRSRQIVNQTFYFEQFANCIKSYIIEFIPDLTSFDVLNVSGDECETQIEIQYTIYGKDYKFMTQIIEHDIVCLNLPKERE